MTGHTKKSPGSTKRRVGKKSALLKEHRRAPLPETKAAPTGGVRQHVFILDSDSDIVEAMGGILEGEGYACRHFTTPERCLSELSRKHCDVVLVETDMGSSDYIEFLGKVRRLKSWLPVIVISDGGTVRHAVTAIKNGASHFITKPLDKAVVLGSIAAAVNGGDLIWENMPEALTESERLVLGWLLRGYSNNQIAKMLGKSARTIEDQRAQVMKKLDVGNVVDLVKLCIQLGILALSGGPAVYGKYRY